MAFQFVEQIMAQAMSASDPQVKIAMRYLDDQSKQMEQELLLSRSNTIESIAQKLAALEQSAPASVRNAYEKLLAQATGV